MQHDQWVENFSGPTILDQLLHHATAVNIKGESYRIEEKRKAGLLAKSHASQPAKVAAIDGTGENEATR